MARRRRSTPDAVVDVLTPPSTVAALKAGYRPLWPEALKAVGLTGLACGLIRLPSVNIRESK